MSAISNLQPAAIWRNFDLLTQVPRPSGHLEKIQQFLLDWAAEKGVEAHKDEAGNILMYKAASPGREDRKVDIEKLKKQFPADRDYPLAFTLAPEGARPSLLLHRAPETLALPALPEPPPTLASASVAP